MNQDTNQNYLTNSLKAAKAFAGRYATKLQEAATRAPWGQYKSDLGSVKEYTKEAVVDQKGNRIGIKPAVPSTVAAGATLDALNNETRQKVSRFTNLPLQVARVTQDLAATTGLESRLAQTVAAAGAAALYSRLSGITGPVSQGMRPAGHKAVIPVSKEEDPTGKTPLNPALEIAVRHGMFQRSQLLPYQEFKKERPDVAPSTFSQYRRYQTAKPEAGKLLSIDPEGQSFTALGGLIRGSAKGLNDPELRVKGMPITASAVAGLGAGFGAMKAASKFLEPPVDVRGVSLSEIGKIQPTLGEKIAQKLGRATDPALLSVGATAALAAGYGTKKLFEKAAERRVKKEDPIEYLKHKHGSFQEAAQALNQPGATSWQQLVPYVK